MTGEELDKLIEEQAKKEDARLKAEYPNYYYVETASKADENRKKLEKERNKTMPGLFDGYQSMKTHDLATGKKSVGTSFGDVAIDVSAPFLLMGLGSLAKNSEAYKGAELRRAADHKNYRFTGSAPLDWETGTTEKPTGVLSRDIRELWGKDASKIIKDFSDKETAKIIKKYKLDKDGLKQAMSKVYHKLGTGAEPEGKLENDLYNFIVELSTLSEKYRDAGAKVKQNIKIDRSTGHDVVEIPKSDKAVLKIPNALEGAGAAMELGTIGHHAMSKGGIQGTGLPSLTEFFEGTGLAYSKRQLIAEINNLYDKAIKEGNYQQRKQAREIMAEINGKKKGDLIDKLEEMKSVFKN